MKTLREKILLLDLKPRNAPAGIKSETFGKWLRAVKAGEEIGDVATVFLHLLCDGRLNVNGGAPEQSEKFDEGLAKSLEAPVKKEKADAKPVVLPVAAQSGGRSRYDVKSYEYPVGSGRMLLNFGDLRYVLPVHDFEHGAFRLEGVDGVFTKKDFG